MKNDLDLVAVLVLLAVIMGWGFTRMAAGEQADRERIESYQRQLEQLR